MKLGPLEFGSTYGLIVSPQLNFVATVQSCQELELIMWQSHLGKQDAISLKQIVKSMIACF